MKRGSSVAVCCGRSPLVVLSVKAGLVEHAFVVNDPRELEEDKRFWEVKYQDRGCPDLGLPKVEVEGSVKRLACLYWLSLVVFVEP